MLVICNGFNKPLLYVLLISTKPYSLTCSSSRWICSVSSWMSESTVFISATLDDGATKTSSFTGPLINTRPAVKLPPHKSLSKYIHAKKKLLGDLDITKQQDSHAHFVSPNNERDLAAPRVDKTGPAGVKYDVFSVPCTEADWCVVKWLPCILKNCKEAKNNMATWRWGRVFRHKTVCLCQSNVVNSLFLWIANIIGRSFGCRWRRTGVPIRSWGRYPRRGTALRDTK